MDRNILLMLISLFCMMFDVNAQEWQYRDGHLFKDGMLFTGVYTEFFDDGSPKVVRSIKDGLEHGKVSLYHSNGKLAEERTYVAGLKNGVWVSWNENGVKVAEASWENGLKHGYWFIWDEQGVKRYEMFYRTGEKAGTWFMWDEEGVLVNRREY